MQPITVVLGTYTAPIEQVDAHRPEHLAFIDGLVAAGTVLAAGRTAAGDGSVILVRGLDGAAALDALAGDPYLGAGVADYAVAGTFTPGRHAPALAALLEP
jgi:hypothetical protein